MPYILLFSFIITRNILQKYICYPPKRKKIILFLSFYASATITVKLPPIIFCPFNCTLRETIPTKLAPSVMSTAYVPLCWSTTVTAALTLQKKGNKNENKNKIKLKFVRELGRIRENHEISFSLFLVL
jgi:hypothetical protein